MQEAPNTEKRVFYIGEEHNSPLCVQQLAENVRHVRGDRKTDPRKTETWNTETWKIEPWKTEPTRLRPRKTEPTDIKNQKIS